jgi:hypothetical protein
MTTARGGTTCRWRHVDTIPLDRMSLRVRLRRPPRCAAHRRTRRNARAALMEGGDKRASMKTVLSVRAPLWRTGSSGGRTDRGGHDTRSAYAKTQRTEPRVSPLWPVAEGRYAPPRFQLVWYVVGCSAPDRFVVLPKSAKTYRRSIPSRVTGVFQRCFMGLEARNDSPTLSVISHSSSLSSTAGLRLFPAALSQLDRTSDAAACRRRRRTVGRSPQLSSPARCTSIR